MSLLVIFSSSQSGTNNTKTLAGSLSFSGAEQKAASHGFFGTMAPASSAFLWAYSRVFAVTQSFVGAITKSAGKKSSGSITVSTISAATAPSPDQHGTANGTNSVVNVTLPSASPNEIIAIAAYSGAASSGTNRTISSISGGSLSFTPYARSHGSNQGSMDVWYAVSASSLGSTTFSVTFSGTYDDASVIVFGIKGASTTSPFDPNASLPATFSSNTNVAPSFTGISTSNAADLLFMVVGSNNSNTLTSPPTGWTFLANISNGGGVQFSNIGAATLGLSSVVSNQTYTWGQVLNSAQGTEGVLLAFTAGVGGSGGFSKLAQKVINGTASFAGTVSKSAIHNISGILTPSAGIFSRSATRGLVAISSLGSTMKKAVTRGLLASIADGSTFTKAITKVQTAVLNSTTSLRRSASRILAATFTPNGNLVKSLSRLLTASLNFVGNLGTQFGAGARNYTQSLSASLTDGAALLKGVSKGLLASISATSTMNRSVSVVRTAILNSSSTLKKTTSYLVSASTDISSGFKKAINTGFTANINFAGNLVGHKLRLVLLSASLGISSSISKSISAVENATLASSSGSIRAIGQVISGVLGFAGALFTALVVRLTYHKELILSLPLVNSLALETNLEVEQEFALDLAVEQALFLPLVTQEIFNMPVENELVLSFNL